MPLTQGQIDAVNAVLNVIETNNTGFAQTMQKLNTFLAIHEDIPDQQCGVILNKLKVAGKGFAQNIVDVLA